MRILVTRPREESNSTAALLQARGHDVVISPLMEILSLEGRQISFEGIQAILATSANGVRALAGRSGRRDLPLFTVGKQTAKVACNLGFTDVRSANGDASELAALVANCLAPENGTLFHAAGRDRMDGLSRELRTKGFAIDSEILYEAAARDSFTPEASAALSTGTLDAVILFSPRSAKIFATLVREAGLTDSCSRLTALCMSDATATALGTLSFFETRIAKRSNQDALLVLLDPVSQA